MTITTVTRQSSHQRLAEPRALPDNASSQIEPLNPSECAFGSCGADCSAGLKSGALTRRAFFIRTLALLCACCLSIGSHYASYILGPLKSRIQRELGTTHTEFGLLFSAYSLNSTWTPLVGGLLASTLGTTFTSILATGVIFLGQLLLLLGDLYGNVRLMALGLFVFGFGVSPLAVVQETIIVRFFKSHGLGVSMAFGLVAGKGASFVAARTSYPLTEHFGSHAPFYVATGLAGLSVIINLVYIASSKWLVDGAGAELEAPDIAHEAKRLALTNVAEAQALERVAEKRKVHFDQITKLGDVFWAYILLNVLCGTIWSPFTHLAANTIENRYGLSEQQAATTASYLLAGSLVLYPICGFLVDFYHKGPVVIRLLLLSSTLTAAAYTWLVLPPAWTQTPIPAIWLFAIGHGFSPLLLVVIVPKIVPLKYVSTALGAHKSLEQTGSTLFQTLAGIILDVKSRTDKPATDMIQRLLNTFLSLNVLHFGSIVLMAFLEHRKKSSCCEKRRAPTPNATEDGDVNTNHTSESTLSRTASHAGASDDSPLLGDSTLSSYDAATIPVRKESVECMTRPEIRRGRFFAVFSFALIVLAWVLFFSTAYYRLGGKMHQ